MTVQGLPPTQLIHPIFPIWNLGSLTMENQLSHFLVDTGVTYLVLSTCISKLLSEAMKVTGASGETLKTIPPTPRSSTGTRPVKNSLYVPE